jgi:PhzF family phenazine biosynthesis protein
MRQRRFIQTDVFASEPTKGNGLAVVVDAEGLTDAQMQAFSTWTNLAETTFLLPPTHAQADYRVRIFTPSREMPFAGHPTLGSCAAWLHCGGVPRAKTCVIQECAIGLIEIDQSGDTPAFVAPPTQVDPMPQDVLDHLLRQMQIDPAVVRNAALLNNGPSWQVLELRSAEDVLAINSGTVQWPEHRGVSVFGAHPTEHECDYEVRNLSPSSGMSEDPITGSLNAAVAIWMQKQGRLTRDLIMAQGTAIGRKGRVSIRSRADAVLIGGHSQVVIDGHVTL